MAKRKTAHKNSIRLNYQDIPLADYALAGVVLALVLFGILMIYDISVVVAFDEFGDRFWFLKHQSIWAIIGITAGFIVSGINYHVWRKISVPLVSGGILLLVLVLAVSAIVYGAKQRLIIPGFGFLSYISIQPSELVKLTLIIYLSSLFSGYLESRKKKKFPHRPFLIITALAAGLTAIEPDLGNAILIAGSAFIVYFAAGAPVLFFAGMVGLGSIVALIYALSSSYRWQRIVTFLNPLHDPEGSSYQIVQILIALGTGGLFGVGLGNSIQKYQYIPEVTTDSIFAVIGEEMGFLGAAVVVAALLFIVWRGLKIAQGAPDQLGYLLAIGITANIGIQTLVNLGGIVGIMPLTGVPLPFISYGGTSLTILLVSVGILLNISRMTGSKVKR